MEDRAAGAILGLYIGEAVGAQIAGPSALRDAVIWHMADVAIQYIDWPRAAQSEAARMARATSCDAQEVEACEVFVRIIRRALLGYDQNVVLETFEWLGDPRVASITAGSWEEKRGTFIRSSGRIVDTLEAALRAVGHASRFEDALSSSIDLDDGTGSICKLTGQLAGAIWGRRAIPTRLSETLSALRLRNIGCKS